MFNIPKAPAVVAYMPQVIQPKVHGTFSDLPVGTNAVIPNNPTLVPSRVATALRRSLDIGNFSEAERRSRTQLKDVQSDKQIVASIIEARYVLNDLTSAEVTPLDVFETLKKMNIVGGADLGDKLTTSFGAESTHVLLARTLTTLTPNDDEPNERPTHPRTPVKIECKTLNDRLADFDILITPATLIGKDLHVSTISDHPDRPRWSGMPSVLYSVPKEYGIDKLGKIDNFKNTIGNAQSFKSNVGFTEKLQQARNSGKHSHAEILKQFASQQVIKDEVKGKGQLGQFTSDLPALLDQLKIFKALKRAEVDASNNIASDQDKKQVMPSTFKALPHNEVLCRLWLWDAAGVEIGKRNIQDGIGAAIELQVARKILSRELEQEGTGHRLFQEFLEQQLSMGPYDPPINRNSVLEAKRRMSHQDKNDVLTAIRQKLDEPISLCVYSAENSTIRGVSENEVVPDDIIEAIDAFLKTRLGEIKFKDLQFK